MSRYACYAFSIISYLFGVLSATDREAPLFVWPIVALFFIYTLVDVFDDSSSAPATSVNANQSNTDKPTT